MVVVAIAGCSGRTINGTACSTDTDCNLFNVRGTCEPTGFCSYPDVACVDGRRYAPAAGDGLGGTCLGGDACGALDQLCCGVDTCGPDLTCTDGRCSCGGAGEACCDGTTCSSELACGAGTCNDPTSFAQVAVGAGHVCVLRTDGTVWCWGFDYKPFPFSAPQISISVIANPAPAPLAGISNVDELRAGEYHTCARLTDKTLACWGHNERGQLGDGTNTNSLAPVAVGGLTNVTLFDAGRQHTCALGSYLGTPGLWCWGRNGEKNHNGAGNPNLGRLGNDSIEDSNVPAAVDLSAATGGGQTVVALSTGGYHTCIATSDNKVWCWGRNNAGQLGDGTTTDRKVPVEVNLSSVTIPNGVTIEQVSCTDGRRKEDSSCLRLSNGAIACWGHGTSGELGDNANTSRTAPSTTVVAAAFDGSKPVQVVSGQAARCARTEAGRVFCWGNNQAGVLGINVNSGTFSIPAPTQLIEDVKQLDMSHHTACAIDQPGRLWCWGTNTRGQSRARPAATQADKSTIQPFQIKF